MRVVNDRFVQAILELRAALKKSRDSYFDGADWTALEDAAESVILEYYAFQQAPTAAADGEPSGYESTTPAYTRYVSPARYAKFSPAVQQWYRPYWTPAPPAAADLLAALKKIAGFRLAQFIGPHDMALECGNVAREALRGLDETRPAQAPSAEPPPHGHAQP